MRARFKSGLLWNLLGAVFTQGGTLAVNVITANILGREVFGQYAFVQSTTLAMSVVAQVATGYTATKYLAEFRSTQKERAGRVLGLCTLVAAGMALVAALSLFLGAGSVAVHALHAPPGLTATLRIAAAAVPFSVMNGLLVGGLAGFEGFRAIARAGIVSGTLNMLFGALGARLFGLNGAVVGLAAGYLGQFIVLSFVLRVVARDHGVQIRLRGVWKERSIILRFAIPAAMNGLSTMPAIWLANVWLARQPNGMSQVALYSAATSFRVMVMFVPLLLNNVGLSILNNQRGLGDSRRYARVFWVNFVMVISVAVLAAGGVAVLGPLLLRIFGGNFDQGTAVLRILLLATVPEAVGIAAYQIIQSQEKMWLSLVAVALPRDVSFALLAYKLAPRLGAQGVALAHLTGVSVACLVITGLSWHIGLHLKPRETTPAKREDDHATR